MGWIEYHDALLDFWKIHRLADKLSIPYSHALGIVSCLWLWTLKNTADGDLSRFTDAELARGAKWSGEGFRDVLVACEIVDKHGRVYKWDRYGDRVLREARARLQRHREGKAKRTGKRR